MSGLKRPRALLDMSSEGAVLSPAEAAAEAGAEARRQLSHEVHLPVKHTSTRDIRMQSSVCAHGHVCRSLHAGISRHALWGDEPPTGRGAKEQRIQNRPFVSCLHKPLNERNRLEAQHIFSDDVS